MKIFRWNNTPMAAGQSTAGEDWFATLARLVTTAMGDGRARGLTTWVIVGEGHDLVAGEAWAGRSRSAPGGGVRVRHPNAVSGTVELSVGRRGPDRRPPDRRPRGAQGHAAMG